MPDNSLNVTVLRPRRSLLASLGIPAAALGVPLIGVIAFVVAPGALWSTIVALALAFLTIIGVGLLQFRLAQVMVSRYGVVERGWFGLVRTVPAREIASILRVRLYRTNSTESSPVLFIIGNTGARRVRLRGHFWSDDTLDQVAPALGVPEVVVDEAFTVAELAAYNPTLVSWVERLLYARGVGYRVAMPSTVALPVLDASSTNPRRS